MPLVPKRSNDAFTLVEMVLSIVILGVSTLAVGSLFIIGLESYGLIAARRHALHEARYAMVRMGGELEVIEHPTTDLSSISATSITFLPAGGGAAVTYSISAGRVMRGSDVLVQNVTAATEFAFFDSTGNQTSTPAAVARIHVIIERDTGVAAYGRIQLRNNIYLRNLYYASFTR